MYYTLMLNLQDWIWFIAIKCSLYDFVFTWVCFFPSIVYRKIASGALVVMVARGAYPIYGAFSTCSYWTRPRLTWMNRSALWQDGGSKRWASSELELNPRFKEASYEIRVLYSSLLWSFNKRPNPISWLVLTLFLLLPLVFSRLDVFYGSSID
jgi:hypothetical protein